MPNKAKIIILIIAILLLVLSFYLLDKKRKKEEAEANKTNELQQYTGQTTPAPANTKFTKAYVFASYDGVGIFLDKTGQKLRGAKKNEMLGTYLGDTNIGGYVFALYDAAGIKERSLKQSVIIKQA